MRDVEDTAWSCAPALCTGQICARRYDTRGLHSTLLPPVATTHYQLKWGGSRPHKKAKFSRELRETQTGIGRSTPT